MKIKSINTSFSIASGTSLQGYIHATYSELVDFFGEPLEGDGCKVSAEWNFDFEDGTVATLYDWKLSEPIANYPLEEYEWHIGGRNQKAVEYLTAEIQQRRELRGQPY